MDVLVTTQWLAGELAAPNLRIADCSWFLPGEARDAAAEFAAGHIPGAVFLDIGAIADPASDLPMMLPPAAQFAFAIGALGIGPGDRIVLYDDSPHHTAARGWAMFRSYGVATSVLDGGLAKWRAEGRPLGTGAGSPTPADARVAAAGIGIADLAAMRAAVAGAAQILDARSPARFAGSEPEPRPGVEPGHMPGAVNLPYGRFFAPDGTWLRGDALRAVFADAGVDLNAPAVATCGSGVTAAVVAFAAHLLGHDLPIYDGSWAEWGSRADTPKVRG